MEISQIVTIIILAVLIVVGLIVAILTLKRGKEDKSAEPNYRAFFIMGVTFIPIGIIWIIVSLSLDISFVAGIPFLGLGVTYLIIGLANRDKWRKQVK